MIQDESNRLYENLLNQFGDTPQAVNWKNKEAQAIRFEQLAKIISSAQPFSVNDLGCGLGDFVSFLSQADLKFTYHGYDILPAMIETARSKFSGTKQEVTFEVITDPASMKVADYTIESGIFNRRFEHSEESWLAYVLKTLHVMFERSRLGFAFNLLTKYSDQELMRKDLYYADPCFLFDYCKMNFSKNVALLHDYGLYDFTILVRKSVA
jgi:hypothetical protein